MPPNSRRPKNGDILAHDRSADKKAQELKYRTVIENLPHLIVRYDSELRRTYVNPAWEEASGLRAEEVVAVPASDIPRVPKPTVEEYVAALRRVLETGTPESLEFTWANARGEPLHLEYRVIPEYGSDGEIEGLLSVGYDVTEHHRAKHELQQSHDLLEAIIQAAPTAIVGLDLDGKVHSVWNPAAERMLGWSAQEVIGKFLPTVAQENREEFKGFRDRIRNGLRLEGAEVRRQKKDGTSIDYSIYASPLCDAEGKITGNIAVLVDITERKRLEEQLRQAQKLEAVGQLAGGVAHDFNNMLTLIIGHAALALDEIAPFDPLHAHLREISEAARRSADLTRQLLAFARKQTIAPRILDLNDTVSGMLNMLRRLIGEDIDLVWRPGAALWRTEIDPSQVDQVLANLCVNARHAITGVGAVTIETDNVTFRDADRTNRADCAPGDYVRLAVSDNGCGMDEQTRTHLFEPFFTTKDTGEGTGLGLATVYGIVRQNDGFISVQSEPEQGTRFEICFPRHDGEAAEVPVEVGSRAELCGKETVLVVEDEPAVLNLGTSVLEELGYTVLAATRPREAVRLAENHPGDIHLLITDVVMPEMEGRVLARRLASANPDLHCLYMSGYTANIITHRGALESGVQFIQKPFSMRELATKVRQVLDGGSSDEA